MPDDRPRARLEVTDRRVRRWFAGLPSPVRIVVAVIAVALGAVLITRPTTSLGVMAILIGAGLVLSGILRAVTRGPAEPAGAWRAVSVTLWIVAGLVVFVLPGLTLRITAAVVGGMLVINGILSVASAIRAGLSTDVRVARVALGVADVVFGILALVWPDITLLVVAVVFGARLLIAGLVELWHAIRGTRPAPAEGPRSRWMQTLGAVLALVLAVAAGTVSVWLNRGGTVADDFYAPPRTVPAAAGQLIRAEAFTRGVPDDARAWRILYTTTDAEGAATVASGLVVVPAHGDGHWPVVDWNHGTTGYAQQCAPSLLAEPFTSGALFLLPQVIDHGWALVATDYIGLGTAGSHPYLIGVPTAHASLDAVRAARELDGARLGDRTVVWGHSQGGGATLWAAALAKSYAADVPLAGAAALAPASDLSALAGNLGHVTGGSVFASFVIAAYAHAYPDVTYRQYVRPGAEVMVRQMSQRCLSSPGMFASVLSVLGMTRDPNVFAADPTTGPLGIRLTENTPPPGFSGPVLVAQGADDPIVVPASQDAYVAGLCTAGMAVEYIRVAGRGHVELVQEDSPLAPRLLQWTADRFAGVAAPAECTRADE